MWNVLKEYDKKNCSVKNGVAEIVREGTGARQGCSLIPYLFIG